MRPPARPKHIAVLSGLQMLTFEAGRSLVGYHGLDLDPRILKAPDANLEASVGLKGAQGATCRQGSLGNEEGDETGVSSCSLTSGANKTLQLGYSVLGLGNCFRSILGALGF